MSDIVQLEQLILAAATEGVVTEELVKTFRATDFSSIDEDDKSALSQACELLLDIEKVDSLAIELILELCDLGLEKPLNEKLGELARKLFSKYPDPAAIQEALKLDDENTAGVSSRFKVLIITLSDFAAASCFPKMKLKDLGVYHSDFGFGVVEELDSLTNIVKVKFKVVQNVPLKFFVLKSYIILAGTTANKLLRGEKFTIKSVLAHELVEQMEKETIPALKFSQAMVTRLVMPTYLKTARAFDEWYRRRVLPAAAGTATGGRTWDKSRSLAEFKEAITKVESVSMTQEEMINILKAFRFSGARPAQNKLFAECLSSLSDKAEDHTYFDQLIEILATEAVIWKDIAEFVKVSTSMNVKTLAIWFSITLEAKGVDYFAADCMALPIKFLNALEKSGNEEIVPALLESAKTQTHNGNLSSDMTVWLWNRNKKTPEKIREVITAPIQIFRALAKDDKSKAGKDLRKFIMSDENFLNFLANDGEDAGVKALVSTVKTFPSLDTGERQSLLVKIVRICPDALTHVEEKKVSVKVGNLPQVTSARSFKALQTEFDKIVNVEIPQNSKDIQVARELGDLRENFEFRAAKDRQKYLQVRSKELDELLTNIGPTDFAEFKVKDRVIPASKVTISKEGKKETFSVVGLLDGDPEKKWLSFETPLAKSMLGKQVGDTIEMPDGSESELLEIAPLDEEVLAFLLEQ
jgi:transcription elongation GreA/GreB family factor